VVYVGARDGMLHAFDTGVFCWGDNPCTTDVGENRGYFQWKDPNYPDDPEACYTSCSVDCEPDYGTGEELWAFIPANLLPRLKNNYLQGDDKAYMDASPALADVHTIDALHPNGAWRTVLLSTEGNGGDTIFCLDVTNPTDPKFMWEFADPDLFRSRSSPSVAQIGRILYQNTTKWVAFFVSGKTYNDLVYPSIFAIDIADGSLVEKIDLDAEPAGAGGVLSGQPTLVDSDGNGYVDRLYIGSDKGRLYKVNIPNDPNSTKYSIGHCVINTDFTDRDGTSPPLSKQYEPIYGSPTVVSSNSVDLSGQMTYDIRLFFGTGDSPYSDEDINFNDTRYAFYAYRDTTAKGVCDDTQVALDWFFELEKGHRIYASAFAAAGNIYFGTSTSDTEDPCDINANSDPDFDANAGKLYAFDLDGIKKFESRWAMCGPHRWSKTNTFTFRRSTATSTRSATVNIIMQPARAVFPKS
jgi:type IV pilus assembly protein PilY1